MAVTLVVSTIVDLRSHGHGTEIPRAALIAGFAMIAVPLLQLLPLPPAIWTLLPGHELARQSFEAASMHLPWLPVSVSPQSTWMNLASLIPPLAVFAAVLRLNRSERRQLTLLILGIGLAGVLLGLFQIAIGPGTSLRFYQYTNDMEAVGFFANRNHFAALNLVLMLFAAAWSFENTIADDKGANAGQWDSNRIMYGLAGFAIMVLLIAGQAMARSRAGLILTIAALVGIFLIAAFDHRRNQIMPRTKVIVGAVVLAVVFSAQFAVYRIIERLSGDPMDDARFTFARNTIEAMKAYSPFGSGMGTFVPVYATFEKPADAISGVYVNHAHNDVLEMLLEAGLPGALIAGALLIGFVHMSLRVWWQSPSRGSPIDLNLARAASIALLLLLAHSFVDYPLRTGAMAVVAAFAAAQLVAKAQSISVHAHKADDQFELHRRRMEAPVLHAKTGKATPPPDRLAARTSTPPAPQRKPIASETRTAGAKGRWGQSVAWPDAWRSSPKDTPHDEPPQTRDGDKT